MGTILRGHHLAKSPPSVGWCFGVRGGGRVSSGGGRGGGRADGSGGRADASGEDATENAHAALERGKKFASRVRVQMYAPSRSRAFERARCTRPRVRVHRRSARGQCTSTIGIWTRCGGRARVSPRFQRAVKFSTASGGAAAAGETEDASAHAALWQGAGSSCPPPARCARSFERANVLEGGHSNVVEGGHSNVLARLFPSGVSAIPRKIVPIGCVGWCFENAYV